MPKILYSFQPVKMTIRRAQVGRQLVSARQMVLCRRAVKSPATDANLSCRIFWDLLITFSSLFMFVVILSGEA